MGVALDMELYRNSLKELAEKHDLEIHEQIKGRQRLLWPHGEAHLP